MYNTSGISDQLSLTDVHVTSDLKRIVLTQPSGPRLKKLIIFIAYPWLLHHQLDFAFAHALRARGVEVVVALCNRVQRSQRQSHGCQVLYAAANPEALCARCHQGFAQLFEGFLQLPLDAGSAADELLDDLMPDITECTLSDAIELSVADVPMFKLAYSTLCTRHRTNPLDQLENWRTLLNEEARVAAKVWMALDQYRLYFEDKRGSTAALIFNGRFTPYRVAYAYFKSLGIDRLVHERGGSDNNYTIVRNKMCTEPLFRCNPLYHGALERLPDRERQQCIQLAAEKLTAKMKGVNTGWFSWVSPAASADSPEEQPGPGEAAVACFFTSSPDEADYIPRLLSVKARQLELLAKVSCDLREIGWETWIRHHPNTSPERSAGGRGVEYYITEAIETASAFDRSVMGDESVNSLDLARASSVCIALTSSICLEIAFCTRKCIVDSSSLFAPLFPQRMVLRLSLASHCYAQQDVEMAIRAEPMNDLEYEHFLLGVYQIYFINKPQFSSFGFVEAVKVRCLPPDVLRGIPGDQRLAEIAATMIDRQLV